jgi:hypothetical protein
MVPRDQLEASEAKLKELQVTLEERVPQSTYDELVYKVVQLAQEVTGGEAPAEEAEASPQPEPTVQEPQEPTAPSTPAAEPEESTPEIREVATQLVELKASAEEAEPLETPSANVEVIVEEPSEQPHSQPVVAPTVSDSTGTADGSQQG